MKNTVLVASLCIRTLCVFNFIEASDLEDKDLRTNNCTKVVPVMLKSSPSRYKKVKHYKPKIKPATLCGNEKNVSKDEKKFGEKRFKNDDDDQKMVENDDDDDQKTVKNNSEIEREKSQKHVTFEKTYDEDKNLNVNCDQRYEQIEILRENIDNYCRSVVLSSMSPDTLCIMNEVNSNICDRRTPALKWIFLCNFCLKNLKLAKIGGYKDIDVERRIYLGTGSIIRALHFILFSFFGTDAQVRKVFRGAVSRYCLNIEKCSDEFFLHINDTDGDYQRSCESLEAAISEFMEKYKIRTLTGNTWDEVVQAYEKYRQFARQEKNKMRNSEGPYHNMVKKITHTDSTNYQKLLDYRRFIAESVPEDLQEKLRTINPALSVTKFYHFDWLVVSNLILSILQSFSAGNEQILWLELFDEWFRVFCAEILAGNLLQICYETPELKEYLESNSITLSEEKYQGNWKEIDEQVSDFLSERKKGSATTEIKPKKMKKGGAGKGTKGKAKKTGTQMTEKTDLNKPVNVTSLTNDKEFCNVCNEVGKVVLLFLKVNGIGILNEEELGRALAVWNKRGYRR